MDWHVNRLGAVIALMTGLTACGGGGSGGPDSTAGTDTAATGTITLPAAADSASSTGGTETSTGGTGTNTDGTGTGGTVTPIVIAQIGSNTINASGAEGGYATWPTTPSSVNVYDFFGVAYKASLTPALNQFGVISWVVQADTNTPVFNLQIQADGVILGSGGSQVGYVALGSSSIGTVPVLACSLLTFDAAPRPGLLEVILRGDTWTLGTCRG